MELTYQGVLDFGTHSDAQVLSEEVAGIPLLGFVIGSAISTFLWVPIIWAAQALLA